MKSSPWAPSKELIHYFEPTQKDGSFDTAATDVGRKDKNIHSLDEQVTTLRNIALKCRLFAIDLILHSDSFYNCIPRFSSENSR